MRKFFIKALIKTGLLKISDLEFKFIYSGNSKTRRKTLEKDFRKSQVAFNV